MAENNGMSDTDKGKLEDNRKYIRETLKIGDVLDQLVDNNIIRKGEKQIFRENPDKAPDLLVDALLEHDTSTTLSMFIGILKVSGYETLVDMFEDQHHQNTDSDVSKSEKAFKNELMKKDQQIETLQSQLERERELKEEAQRKYDKLFEKSALKDSKIKELKAQIHEHEERIKSLEMEVDSRRANGECEKRFAAYDEQIATLTARLDRLDPGKPLFVGNMGTNIQTHVHMNQEESDDMNTSSRPSVQPMRDRAYRQSRYKPHLLTPITPRGQRSKAKKKKN